MKQVQVTELMIINDAAFWIQNIQYLININKITDTSAILISYNGLAHWCGAKVYTSFYVVSDLICI